MKKIVLELPNMAVMHYDVTLGKFTEELYVDGKVRINDDGKPYFRYKTQKGIWRTRFVRMKEDKLINFVVNDPWILYIRPVPMGVSIAEQQEFFKAMRKRIYDEGVQEIMKKRYDKIWQDYAREGRCMRAAYDILVYNNDSQNRR